MSRRTSTQPTVSAAVNPPETTGSIAARDRRDTDRTPRLRLAPPADRRMRRTRDRTIRSEAARRKPRHIPSGHVFRVKEHFLACRSAEERVTGLPRVIQDRPHRRGLPAVRELVPILIRPSRRRTRDRIMVEAVSHRPAPRCRTDTPRRSAEPRRPLHRHWRAPSAGSSRCLTWVRMLTDVNRRTTRSSVLSRTADP